MKHLKNNKKINILVTAVTVLIEATILSNTLQLLRQLQQEAEAVNKPSERRNKGQEREKAAD